MTPERPNLLLFMPDQLRADAVGAFGNRVVETPNIDALAGDGVRMSNAYSQHSVCTQSRISMFTGLYPRVAGHRSLDHLLAEHERNIFRRLRDGGYHVALAGARGDMMAPGVTRSSSSRFGFTDPPVLADLARWHSSPFEPGSKWYGAFYGGPVDGELFEFDAATVGTAVDWLGDGLPKPWCLFVPLMFPHPPFHGRATVVRPLRGRGGAGAGSAAPRRQAWLPSRDPLPLRPRSPRRRRLERDHPDVLRDGQPGGRPARTGARRRCSRWLRGTDRDLRLHRPRRVPWRLRIGGEVPLRSRRRPGEESAHRAHVPGGPTGTAQAFVEMVDLTATLEELAGIEPVPHFGKSIVPVLEDPATDHRDAAFSEGGFLLSEEPLLEDGDTGQYRHKQAIQHESPELVGRPVAVRSDRWCYVEPLYEGPELYDRVADPYEANNLAGRAELADEQRALRERIFPWLFETSDVLPLRRDPRMDDDLRQALLGG